jgi:hypothetical protein
VSLVPRDPGDGVEPAVEGHDPGDATSLHDRKVDDVAGGQVGRLEHRCRTLHVGALDVRSARFACGAQSVPHPRGRRLVAAPRESLDLNELVLVKQDLMPSRHSHEPTRRSVPTRILPRREGDERVTEDQPARVFDMPHARVTLTPVGPNVEIEVWPKTGQSAYAVVDPTTAVLIARQLVELAAAQLAAAQAPATDATRSEEEGPDVHGGSTGDEPDNLVDLASRRPPRSGTS